MVGPKENRMNPVRSKRDFVRRYQAGEFGNASPTWDTLDEYLKSGYVGPLHIRNRIKGGPTWYDVPCEEIEERWYGVLFYDRAEERDLYISAMAPTDLTLIQGEVQRGFHGVDLFYSTVPKPMRVALMEDGKQIQGASASSVLHSYLNSRSHEWMTYLLEAYPDHVIEFSTYDVNWGTHPGYNTCFWEVRLY